MKSYLIDTNYFLRLLLKDNLPQYKKVRELFDLGLENKVELYSTVAVFFEIYWVLSSFYKKDKKKCTDVLGNILAMNFLRFENSTVLQFTLKLYTYYAVDLEDCYNLAVFAKEDIDDLATFDKKVKTLSKKL